jgi:hypothetical protein
MTATMTETEFEIEFVLWEAEDPLNRPCEADRQHCPNVALYRMLWVPSTGAQEYGEAVCLCGSSRLCLGCKDWVLGQEPGDMEWFKCMRCNGFADLKGIEPIRGKA